MPHALYAVATTTLALLALAALFALRWVGLYSHQALAVLLLLGLAWAVASRAWLARKGRLHTELLRGFRDRRNRPQLLQAAGRGSFWAAAGGACVAVFPRSDDLTPFIIVTAAVAVLRTAASLLPPRRTNAGPTLVMAAGAAVLVFDLGRAFVGAPGAVVQLAPPFDSEWLVIQGGRSPLQNHHLAAYNQRFALDMVRLNEGRVFGDAEGNAGVHSWEQPLRSPTDGTVVLTRGDMEDAKGFGAVSEAAAAAGNVIVIELDTGHFVVLAHLRRGTLSVREGDRVKKGDPLAQVGNSGNTTMPHLHLQVQTHRDLWHPDNRSVPFAFAPGHRALARNDRIHGSPREAHPRRRSGNSG